MRNNNVKSITYGAIFCALVGVLLVFNRQLANAFDAYLLWIIPIPLIIYASMFGMKNSIIVAITMVAVAVLTTGFSFTTIFYAVGSIVAGLAYSYGLLKNKSGLFLISSVVVCSLIMMIISTFFLSSVFGYDLVQEVKLFQEMINQTLTNTYTSAGLDASSIKNLFSYELIFQIYVISLVLTSVLEGILVHLIAYIVLRRLKMKLPPMKPVSEIYAPFWAKLYVFIAFVANFGSKLMKITEYDNIIMPIFIVAEVIVFFFGMIFVMTFVALKVRNKGTYFLILILIFVLFPITCSIILGIGVFDMFSSARKTILERNQQNVHQNG